MESIQQAVAGAAERLREVQERLLEIGKAYEQAGAAASRVTTSLNLQLAELNRLRDAKRLTAQEELDILDAMAQRYELSAQQRLQLDARVHEAFLRQLGERMAAVEEQAARPGGETDFMAQMQEFSKLREAYAGQADAVALLDAAIADAATARAEKVARLDRAALEQFIDSQQRMVDVAERSSGLIQNGVEQRYDPQVQLDAYDRMIQAIEQANQKLLETQTRWTAAEKQIYDRNLQQIEQYVRAREDLQIDTQKAQQRAEAEAAQEAAREAERQAAEALRRQEEEQRRRLQSAKGYIDAQLKLLRQAHEQELAARQTEIDALDRQTLRQNRQEQDAESADRILRLRTEAEYTPDEYNRAQLLRQAEREQADWDKRRREEETQDRKTALRQEMEDIRAQLRQREDALREYRESEQLKTDVWAFGMVENTVRALSGLQGAAAESAAAMLEALRAQAPGFQQTGAELSGQVFGGFGQTTASGVAEWGSQAKRELSALSDLFYQSGVELGQRMAAGFQSAAGNLAAQVGGLGAPAPLSAPPSGGGTPDAGQTPSISVKQVIQSVVATPFEVAQATKRMLSDLLKAGK